MHFTKHVAMFKRASHMLERVITCYKHAAAVMYVDDVLTAMILV